MLTFFAALLAAQTQMPPIGQRAAAPEGLAVAASLIPDPD